jgi:hypothetical protein
MRLPTASYRQPGRNAARLLNCYAEQSVGKTPVNVIGAPGIVTQRALTGPGRGFLTLGGTLYAVAGSTLYDAAAGVSLGTIPGSDVLTFAATATEAVTDNGYHFNGTTVSAITDLDKVPWSTVDYCDGRAVFVETGTGRFGATELNDLDNIDGLDFATAEGAPDDLISLVVSQRQVVLIGRESTEIWWNSGASGFPFERLGGGFQEMGGLSRLGRCKADNTVFMLANDRTARVLRGSVWQKVSQPGVEEAWAAYYVDDCECFSLTWAGHIWVFYRFPTQGATWVLDVTTGEWWESEWDIVASATHNGRVYVQHSDGSVGYLSSAAWTWFGDDPRYSITFPNVYSGQKRQFFSQFDAVLQTGYVDAGITPHLTLEVSHNGGSTYHTLPVKELGRTGEYSHVARWNRLGAGRDTVFRLSCADAVPFVLTDAQVEAEAGSK